MPTINNTLVKTIIAVLIGLPLPFFASGQHARIEVDASHILNTINHNIFGACIENVNHEIYGGLYDQRLYGESFEEPAPSPHFEGWKTYGGNWMLNDQAVSVNAGPGYKIVRDNPVFENGSVEADIRIANGYNAGLLLRVTDAGKGADNFNGYEVSLNPEAQSIILGKHRHNWQPLTESKFTFHTNEWVHVKVLLQGPRIRVYANGQQKPVIDFTDKENILPAGQIALRTYNASAAFRRIIIHSRQQVIRNDFRAMQSPAVSAAWDPFSTDKNGAFMSDTTDAYNGQQSQVTQRSGGSGKTGIASSGLNRWGIALKKGQWLQGRVYLRADHLKGPVTLALQSADGRVTYAEQKIRKVSAAWNKFSFHLRSDRTDPHARFVLYIDKPGRLWVDQAVLMSDSADQFNGLPLRADIATKMQQEGLTFLRYGGSMVNASAYRWKNMTGDPDKRPPYKGTWYPYSSNGFGIEEFLQFCEAAGFEPAFAINIEETPGDVADMVTYLTGDTGTAEGRRRAENGHPKPYHIPYIEIGNEEVIGKDDPAQYAHYIKRFKLLHQAIHRKNPDIRFVIAAWWRPHSASMEKIFSALDGIAAYWDLHVDADAPDAGSTVDKQLTQMQHLFFTWDPHTKMKCAIFEENGGLHNMQRALGHATILNTVRRHADFLLTSCAANALQPLGQNDNGWNQGQIFFTPSRVWGMPPFYAQQMASENYQPLLLYTKVSGALDVTATRSNDSRQLVVHVVNPTGDGIAASVSLNGFSGFKPEVKAYSLSGPLKSVNTANDPTRISTHTKSLHVMGSKMEYNFPAHSYVILRFEK